MNTLFKLLRWIDKHIDRFIEKYRDVWYYLDVPITGNGYDVMQDVAWFRIFHSRKRLHTNLEWKNAQGALRNLRHVSIKPDHRHLIWAEQELDAICGKKEL